MTQRERIIDRIKKLRELGDQAKNNSVHEAAAAAAAAQRLQQQYKIEFAELDDDGDDTDLLINVDLMEGSKEKLPVRWKIRLANRLCQNLHCRMVYTPSRRSRIYRRTVRGKITIMGRQSDIDAVTYLYQALCREITRLCKLEAGKVFEPGEDGKRAWCTAFRIGAANEIGRTLERQKMTLAEELAANAKADALVKKQDKEVKDYASSLFPDTHKTSAQIRDYDGYERGKEVGKTINVGGSSGRLRKPAAQLEAHNGE